MGPSLENTSKTIFSSQAYSFLFRQKTPNKQPRFFNVICNLTEFLNKNSRCLSLIGYGYESDISNLVLVSPPSEVTSATTRLNQRFGVYFKKNALESGKYRFRVSANTTACSSYSETEFTVNGPPIEGGCSKGV